MIGGNKDGHKLSIKYQVSSSKYKTKLDLVKPRQTKSDLVRRGKKLQIFSWAADKN